MGSPALIVKAELTMQHIEKTINADSTHDLNVWKTYVDYSFGIL